MHSSALDAVLILMVLSVVSVALLRRFNLPPILGYLFVGVLAGPHALGWVPDSETIHLLAEVGVVFLLFTIGLEFSIPHLLAMKSTVLGLGGAQVVLSALVVGVIAYFTGISWQGALIVGGALAMSSTAIVIKQLTEQLEMQSRHGRIALGILLFQDIAVVPFLVVIPILAGGTEQNLAWPLLLALGKGALAFGLMFALGHWALRPLFHVIAAARSAELFTLTAVLVALAAAWITNLLGLSLALGAFLAGMMLGETEYRHQIETDIRPFRDILMGLFFISVGTQLNIGALPEIWGWVALLVLALVLGKGLIIALLARLAGYENGVSLRAGTVLAQGGEFGFALLTLALARELLSAEDSQPILAAVIISMAIAPLLIRYNGDLAKKLFSGSYLKGRQVQTTHLSTSTHDISGHVVICGFGRIGQNLAGFLREEGIRYVALDLDPTLTREAWEAGEQVFYGDATHIELLEAAGLSRARALVVTHSDAHTAERIIHNVRKHNAAIPIVARTRDDVHLEKLEAAGASEVVPEAVEASMMLATHLLKLLDVPMEEVLRLIEQARSDHYRSLRGFFHGTDTQHEDPFHLHTVVLPPRCRAIGRAIAELHLPGKVSVISLKRGSIRGDAPSSDMVLREGDAVVLQGPPEDLQDAEEKLLKG